MNAPAQGAAAPSSADGDRGLRPSMPTAIRRPTGWKAVVLAVLLIAVPTVVAVGVGIYKVRTYLTQRDQDARLRREADAPEFSPRTFPEVPPPPVVATGTPAPTAPAVSSDSRAIPVLRQPAPAARDGTAPSVPAVTALPASAAAAAPSRLDSEISVVSPAETKSAPQDPSIRAIEDAASRAAQRVAAAAGPAAFPGAEPAGGDRAGSIGRELASTRIAAVRAVASGSRSLILPRSTAIPCALDTALDVTQPGLTSCTVTRNVYSADGRTLLVERGSRVDGEYTAGVRTGTSRIFVLWSRIVTPEGVRIDVESPAADELGRSGVPGEVDNRWGQRVGGAFLLSLVQDTVAAVAAKEAGQNTGAGVVYQNTQRTGETLVAKVLDSTISLPATYYKGQGDRVLIYVARDVDFGGVYALKPE